MTFEHYLQLLQLSIILLLINNLEECIQIAKIYLKLNKLGDGYRIISSDGVTVSEVTNG